MEHISSIRRKLSLTVAAILLILTLPAPLSACQKKYTPIPSSGEELRTVMTIGGFEVPYEQYRYFFLGYKSELEKNNSEITPALESRLKKTVMETLRGVYATLSLCAEYGINIKDSDISEAVDEYINNTLEEYGEREKYTAALKEQNLNDSTFRFFTAVDICESNLFEKLTQELDVIPSDRDSVISYLESDAVVRIAHVFIQNDPQDNIEENRTLANEVSQKALAGVDFELLIKDYSEDFNLPPDGLYINHLDMPAEYENAAFNLSLNESSAALETDSGFYVLKRLPKDAEYIENNYQTLKSGYLESTFYTLIEEKRANITLTTTEFYKTLDINTIK